MYFFLAGKSCCTAVPFCLHLLHLAGGQLLRREPRARKTSPSRGHKRRSHPNTLQKSCELFGRALKTRPCRCVVVTCALAALFNFTPVEQWTRGSAAPWRLLNSRLLCRFKLRPRCDGNPWRLQLRHKNTNRDAAALRKTHFLSDICVTRKVPPRLNMKRQFGDQNVQFNKPNFLSCKWKF